MQHDVMGSIPDLYDLGGCLAYFMPGKKTMGRDPLPCRVSLILARPLPDGNQLDLSILYILLCISGSKEGVSYGLLSQLCALPTMYG